MDGSSRRVQKLCNFSIKNMRLLPWMRRNWSSKQCPNLHIFLVRKLRVFRYYKIWIVPCLRPFWASKKALNFHTFEIVQFFETKYASALVANTNLVIKTMFQFAHLFNIFRFTRVRSRIAAALHDIFRFTWVRFPEDPFYS